MPAPRKDRTVRPTPPVEATADTGPTPATASGPVPAPPAALGPYRIIKELGRGGMGAVYAAEDTHLHRTVALKVMAPGLSTRPEALPRFLREARAMAAVKHDHIVTIYQVGEADGTAYLAMELLEGAPLNKWLAKNPQPKLGVAVRLAKEIARGLAAAHAKGLVHRDIKPGNVWLEAPKGRVKLLDFGLARLADGDLEITAGGTTVGTPAYMAPEQARGAAVDGRADLWSLGVLLFRMVTGRLPFLAPNMMAMMSALIAEDVPPVRSLAPETPAALADLIDRLLRKKPDERPSSAAAVADELQAIERSLSGSGSQTDATPVPPPLPVAPKRSRLWLGIGAAAALVLIVGTVAALMWPGKSSSPPVPPAPTPEVATVTPTPAPTPAPPTPVAPPPADNRLPAMPDDWLARVRALPPDDQEREVAAEIAQRNPGHIHAPRFEVRDGRIVGFALEGGPALRDLAPVAGLSSLESFAVAMPEPTAERGPWADLSALRGLKLKTLDLRRCPVNDLAPLDTGTLRRLTLIGTRVENLSPLANCPIETATMTGTPVRSLDALKAAPLAKLDCASTPVADLTPLAATPLAVLRCDPDLARRSSGLFKTIPTLTTVNGVDWRMTERFAAATDLTPVGTLSVDTTAIHRVAFAPDGKHLATGVSQGTVYVWNLAQRSKHTFSVSGGSLQLETLAWRDPTRLMVAGRRSVHGISIETNLLESVPIYRVGMSAFALSPDGMQLVIASAAPNNGTSLLSQAQGPDFNQLLPRAFTTAGTVYAILFDLDSKQFITASSGLGGGICRWNSQFPTPLQQYTPKGSPAPTALAYAPDGRFLASRDDASLAVYDLEQQPQQTVNLPFSARAITASPAGVVIVGDGDHGYVLDPNTFEPRYRLPGIGRAGCSAFAPDGLNLAVGCDDGTTRLWTLPAPPTVDATQPLAPLDPAWIARVAALPADEQRREVSGEIARRNPGYWRKPRFEVSNGKVIGCYLTGTRTLRDLAPVAALSALESFGCTMPTAEADKGAWDDLTPLRGLPLKIVSISGTRVASLEPLRGAPLRSVHCKDTRVTDLAPVLVATLEMLDSPDAASPTLPAPFTIPTLRWVNGRQVPRNRYEALPELNPTYIMGQLGALGHRLAFSPDGRLLAMAGLDSSIMICDTVAHTNRPKFMGGKARLVDLVWVDNSTLVVGSNASPPTVYGAGTGKPTGTVPHDPNIGYSSLALTHDRKTLLVGTEAYNATVPAVHRYTMPGRTPLKPLVGLAGDTTQLAARHDGRHIAGSSGPDMVVWESSTGRVLHRLPATNVSCYLYTPGGRLLLARAGTLELYPDTYKTPTTGATAFQRIRTVVGLSGNRLLVVGDGADAIIHDGTTLEPQFRLQGGAGVEAASTAEGKQAATTHSDGSVRLWTIPNPVVTPK